MYLRARIKEGEFSLALVRRFSQVGCNNPDIKTVGFYDIYSQDGYNRLYELGRTLWSAGHISQYEIGVFDCDQNLRLLVRPDLDNFVRNEYQTCFYEIDGIIEAQRDIVPIRRFLEDCQKNYWDRYTWFFAPSLCAEWENLPQDKCDLSSKLKTAEEHRILLPCFGHASYYGVR